MTNWQRGGLSAIVLLGIGVAIDAEARTVAGNTAIEHWYTSSPSNCFYEYYGQIRTTSSGTDYRHCKDGTLLANVPVVIPLPVDTNIQHTVDVVVTGANTGYLATSTISCTGYGIWNDGGYMQSSTFYSNQFGTETQTLGHIYTNAWDSASMEMVCYLPVAGQGVRSVVYIP